MTKRIAIAIAVLVAGALGVIYAQTNCHDEMVCTPMGGCRWVAVCAPAGAPPPPPRPRQCHDEMICTPMGGCRWVSVCN